MKFFIPHLAGDPGAAETEWERYLQEAGAPADSKRVYSMTYVHNGDKYEVKVGEPRKRYPRTTGPRGGYRKEAGFRGWGSPTGTDVSGIVHSGDVIYVWSCGPPFRGWANPSMVGLGEVTAIEYFETTAEDPAPAG